MRQTDKLFIMLCMILGTAFLPLCGFASSSYAIGLKEHSIIKDHTIKLGDIFYDLPRDEDRVLGNAPQPGEEMILSARTLLRIATALDLPWRPSNSMTRVVLRREATVIDYDTIKQTINSALGDENVYGAYELSIPAHYQKIVLPADSPARVEVTRIDVDSQHKSFNATLAAPSAANPIRQIQISGQIHPVIKVPVLLDNIENGRVIQKDDIKIVSIREHEFSKDIVVHPYSLLGMTARRIVVAGRPVRQSDIIAPKIIERGQLITLSLSSGTMRLATQAKALENGAKGDTIRVVNTASNQTLQAVILDSGLARVAAR
ncbi:MAG: flagellar basal body P-ring formation chaperone FlgA [Alphaproteobacteria bacterium]